MCDWAAGLRPSRVILLIRLVDHFALSIIAEPPFLIVGTGLAALVGFSNQRGGTCTVSAVEDLIRRRRPGRLLALAEASIWAFALAIILEAIGLLTRTTYTYPIGLSCISGGVLLGFGAWLNRACLFGTLARIGNNDLHYMLTLLGLLAGFWVHAWLFEPVELAKRIHQPDLTTQFSFALLCAGGLLVRASRTLERVRSFSGNVLRWDPHTATVVQALAFVSLACIAGVWTYSDTLRRLVHQQTGSDILQLLLFGATLAGACAGGWYRAKRAPLSYRKALTCLVGGVLMALGTSQAFGGNDLLLLTGLPLLQGHAIVTLAVMVTTISMCLFVTVGLDNFAAS